MDVDGTQLLALFSRQVIVSAKAGKHGEVCLGAMEELTGER